MGEGVRKKKLVIRLDSHTTPRTISVMSAREVDGNAAPGPHRRDIEIDRTDMRNRLLDEVTAQVQYFLDDVFEGE